MPILMVVEIVGIFSFDHFTSSHLGWSHHQDTSALKAQVAEAQAVSDLEARVADARAKLAAKKAEKKSRQEKLAAELVAIEAEMAELNDW